MSEALFDIVFYGILQPGKDKDVVMQNMAKMFKTEPAKLAAYFAGGRKVIKANVDDLMADKYRVALENIGLVIKIEEVAAEPAPAEPPAQAPGSTPSPTASPATLTAKIAQQAADVDTGDITLAEVGADVIENPIEVAPQEIGDISDITMAEVGADVIENPKEKEKAPIPDISGLSLE
ncbi:MAG: hypothetical protein OQK32_05880 [Gammaproteobacteria bacterium]|nr:hypothetical protein [Gammaproteobacteria bacterium]MCW8923072.1 hypothetical protein [Gammaproteobacteria bacterium]